MPNSSPSTTAAVIKISPTKMLKKIISNVVVD
jgi:hypothetical protein